jgi:hypothetical protein
VVKRNVVGNIPTIEEELSWLKPSAKKNVPKEVPAHSKIEHKENHNITELQKRRNTDIQKRKITDIRKPQLPKKTISAKNPKTNNIHISFWFPITLAKKLKENAVLNNMSLSGFISKKLINTHDKNIDISAIKKIPERDTKAQLSIMLPGTLVKAIKLEAIKKNISYTDLLIAKLI